MRSRCYARPSEFRTKATGNEDGTVLNAHVQRSQTTASFPFTQNTAINFNNNDLGLSNLRVITADL